MLASLLLNNAYAGHGKPKRDYVSNDRFIHYQGVTYDTDDKPEKETVRRIVKAVAKINVPKEVRTEINALSRVLLDDGAQRSIQRQLERARDYRRLAELLRAHVQEVADAEEAAFMLLLMEL